MRSRITIVAVAAVLSMPALSACGDGDDGSDGALSETAFATKANSLCREASAERRTITSAVGDELGQETADKLDEVIKIDEQLLEDVDDLVPPVAEQDTVDQLLDRWRERIDLEHQDRDAVAAGDGEEVQSVRSDIQALDVDANPIAGGLRLNECARGE